MTSSIAHRSTSTQIPVTFEEFVGPKIMTLRKSPAVGVSFALLVIIFPQHYVSAASATAGDVADNCGVQTQLNNNIHECYSGLWFTNFFHQRSTPMVILTNEERASHARNKHIF